MSNNGAHLNIVWYASRIKFNSLRLLSVVHKQAGRQRQTDGKTDTRKPKFNLYSTRKTNSMIMRGLLSVRGQKQ